MAAPSTDRPTVAIAGATGFIGTAVRNALSENYDIIGLTRSPVRARANSTEGPHEEWRHCDLFDPYSVRDGLEGADYAIYFVHSMLPSSRLTQARVDDLDLLLADNFARAAELQGVKHILYLGGLIPEDYDGDLPTLLRSRLEVEQALGSSTVPLTTIRAGLIVGPGGTWLRQILNLVRRLPFMVLPQWTMSETQPIALDDAVRAMMTCLGEEKHYGKVYDIGGPEVMTYQEMLARTANVLGLKRYSLTAPADSPTLSKLWVRIFGGVPWPLVSKVIDRLRFQCPVRSNPLQREIEPEATSFEDALRASVDETGRPLPNPRKALRDHDDAVIRSDSVARSVQRLPLPPGYTAHDVANEYMRWLPRIGWPILKVRVTKGRRVEFQIRPFNITLLELSYDAERSPEGNQLFHVEGGFLADMSGTRDGRLEFRAALDDQYIIAAVHDFAPRLPWYVYNATQAIAHLLVMNGFGRHLRKLKQQILTSSSPETSEEATSAPSPGSQPV